MNLRMKIDKPTQTIISYINISLFLYRGYRRYRDIATALLWFMFNSVIQTQLYVVFAVIYLKTH